MQEAVDDNQSLEDIISLERTYLPAHQMRRKKCGGGIGIRYAMSLGQKAKIRYSIIYLP
jgi:hypothetical protein